MTAVAAPKAVKEAITPEEVKDNPLDLAKRCDRQKDLVPMDKLKTMQVVIVGVGAIGRQVALQLAAMGTPHITIIDFDTVEAVNLAPQGYMEADLGKAKVEATAAMMKQINSGLDLTIVNGRFRKSDAAQLSNERSMAVFCCVDSISTRKLIWEAIKPYAAFWADARMLKEVMRVFNSTLPITDEYYATTLFEENETQGGTCTAKSTIYTASIAAGMMIAPFTAYLRGIPTAQGLELNILTSEFAVLKG